MGSRSFGVGATPGSTVPVGVLSTASDGNVISVMGSSVLALLMLMLMSVVVMLKKPPPLLLLPGKAVGKLGTVSVVVAVVVTVMVPQFGCAKERVGLKWRGVTMARARV